MIRIASVNCQGLHTSSKRQYMLNVYKKQGYSIICFQDTHFTTQIEPFIETYIKFIWSFCLLFNNNFKLNIHSEIEDNDGNLLAIDITVEEIQATIIKFTVKILTILVFTKKVRDIYQT